jgi:hypothetical protein
MYTLHVCVFGCRESRSQPMQSCVLSEHTCACASASNSQRICTYMYALQMMNHKDTVKQSQLLLEPTVHAHCSRTYAACCQGPAEQPGHQNCSQRQTVLFLKVLPHSPLTYICFSESLYPPAFHKNSFDTRHLTRDAAPFILRSPCNPARCCCSSRTSASLCCSSCHDVQHPLLHQQRIM